MVEQEGIVGTDCLGFQIVAGAQLGNPGQNGMLASYIYPTISIFRVKTNPEIFYFISRSTNEKSVDLSVIITVKQYL